MESRRSDIEAQRRGSNDVRNGSFDEKSGHIGPVDPSSRLPIEYRTLSINVENPTPGKGRLADKRKAAVKGGTRICRKN
ncbi:hypothetical protein CVT25_000057 [Psilocybe cyanescens]|uniref:Uncharacterized protein n=1 Tax=Psilocybe cyanescens TaxID=93625 RepID=A0A409X8J9_PSICY|nr:hypothetical protein CVT25_000057 [Psilocybe cyanescens]